MKYTILNCIKITLFILIFLGLYIILTYIKKPETTELNIITGFYAEEKNSLDVVYVGGSASFVYYEPLKAYEDYGIVSYDFGSSMMQAELLKYMVKEALSRQDPKLIIIDARPFQYWEYSQSLSPSAYRNALTGTPLNYNKINFINTNVPKYLKEEPDSYYFDLNLYHTSTETPSLAKALKMIFNKNKNLDKGFHFVPKAVRIQKENFQTDKEGKVADGTLEILQDLLNYLKTIDTKVLFVVSPYIETIKEKEIFNYVERIIKEQGFDFIDANEFNINMGINYDTDFYNENHVNIFGADKYTKFLSEYIKSNYDIPDRRDDEKYSSWNDLLDSWHNEVKNTKEEITNIINGDYYYDYIQIK